MLKAGLRKRPVKETRITRKVWLKVKRQYNGNQGKKVINNIQCCKGQEKEKCPLMI